MRMQNWLEGLDPVEDMALLCQKCKEQELDIENIRCKEQAMEQMDLSRLAFEHVLFENVKFTASILYKCDFIDAVFRFCDFSNCDMSEIYLSRCRFECCKGVGANMRDGNLKNTAIADCNLRYADFDGAKLKNVQIVSSDLSNAVLSSCKLEQVLLRDVNLTQCNFFHTKLRGMDFTKTQLQAVTLGLEDAKGAIVTPLQAADLARLMGLIIREE